MAVAASLCVLVGAFAPPQPVRILRHARRNRMCMSAGGAGNGEVMRKESVLFDGFCQELPRMDGKVVAITGCTSGIGYIVARTVLQRGAVVVMLNRPSPRAEAAVAVLREEVDYKFPQLDTPETADIEVQVARKMAEMGVVPIECDLADFQSVKNAYLELRTKFPSGIDVLALNGGIGAPPPVHVGEKYEPMMLTNHLAHFLLVDLLLPSMEQRAATAGETRVVSMTSEARKTPPTPLISQAFAKEEEMTFDALWKKTAKNDELYHQSKLAVAVFSQELHRRLQNTHSKVKSVLAHPGLCTTQAALDMFATISSDNPTLGVQVASFVNSSAQGEEDGAMGMLRAICSSQVEGGSFYGPDGMSGAAVKLVPEVLVSDPDAGEMLWKMSTAAILPFTMKNEE